MNDIYEEYIISMTCYKNLHNICGHHAYFLKLDFLKPYYKQTFIEKISKIIHK